MTTAKTTAWRSLLAATLLTIGTATVAAPVSLPTTITPAGGGFNGTQWSLGNGIEPSGIAFGFNDAQISGHGDAYDGAWAFTVDGLWVDAPGNTADLTGSILTTPTVSRSGLNVNVQHYYSPTSSLARIMLVMQNPSAAPITATVQAFINYGSDGGTIYQLTSSGDSAITTADRWVVSSDSSGPSDPVNTSVMYGPGSPRVVPAYYGTTVFNRAGSEGLGAGFNVTVPAGQTRSLMFFAGLGGVTVADNTLASAISAANQFNSLSTFAPDWLSGLSAQQQQNVVNWALDPFTTCAAEGFAGGKLSLCRQICEIPQTPTALSGLIRMYRAAFRENPPCA